MSITITDTRTNQQSKYRDLNFLNDVETTAIHVDDFLAVRNSILNIMNTKKGSRILDPEFGSNLDQFLFIDLNNDNAIELAEHLEEVLAQEPRVNILNIIVEMDMDNNSYNVLVIYNIPSLSPEEISLSIGLGEDGMILNTNGFNSKKIFENPI